MAQQRLADWMAAFRVVIVNGPRQAGKTTLLRLFHEEHGGSFRSLDDSSVLGSAKADPGALARFGTAPRLIDEIQLGGDELVREIKYVVDSENSRGQFVLSGSTRFLTMPGLSESLAGRAVFVELWPLTLAERTGASGDFCEKLFKGQQTFAMDSESGWTRQKYFETICAGGYPEALEIGPRFRTAWFEGYLSTVVLRDIGGFAQIQATDLIPRMLAMLAARAGGQAVLADLAKSLEINHATARNYLSYLDMVFLTAQLSPWSSNLSAKHVKSPKIYPTDSGLAAHLLRADVDAVAEPGNPLAGILTETFVFDELTRLLAVRDNGASLHFYRDRDGREVDFVLERRDGRIVAIEVKAASTVNTKDFRHLRWLAERLGDRFAGGYVLHLGSGVLSYGDRMTALPLSAMWEHRSVPGTS